MAAIFRPKPGQDTKPKTSITHWLKGRGSNVCDFQVVEALATLEATAALASSCGAAMRIGWDGDGLATGSFTEVLLRLLPAIESGKCPCLATMYNAGALSIVYITSTTNPHPMATRPTGCDPLAQAFGDLLFFSVDASPDAANVALNRQLYDTIIQENTTINTAPTPASDMFACHQMLRGLFGDGSGVWQLSDSGRFEEDQYGGYGYFLLGRAGVVVMDVSKITYVGLGATSGLEYLFNAAFAAGVEQVVL